MDLLVGKIRMVRLGVGEGPQIKKLFNTRDRVATETERRETLGAGRRHVAARAQGLDQEAAQHQNQPGPLPAGIRWCLKTASADHSLSISVNGAN